MAGSPDQPFGPTWTWEPPEGGPEAQLYRALELGAGLVAAAMDAGEPMPARKGALRAASALLGRARQSFEAWESDALFQEGFAQTTARAIAVAQARDDLAQAQAIVEALGGQLEASLPPPLKASWRPPLPRSKAKAG